MNQLNLSDTISMQCYINYSPINSPDSHLHTDLWASLDIATVRKIWRPF